MHTVCVFEKFALKIQHSAGNCYDAPSGQKLIKSLSFRAVCYLLMDCAYEDNGTQALVRRQGLIFVVSLKKSRKIP